MASNVSMHAAITAAQATVAGVGVGTFMLARWAVSSLCDALYMPDDIDRHSTVWWGIYGDWLEETADNRAQSVRMVSRLLPYNKFPEDKMYPPGAVWYGWSNEQYGHSYLENLNSVVNARADSEQLYKVYPSVLDALNALDDEVRNTMKLAVTGGRNFNERDAVYAALDNIHNETPVTLLIHGVASGADTLAGEWAKSRGVPVEEHPADWKAYGRMAGPLRNAAMIRRRPDVVVAFPGGIGTANMVSQSRKSGLRVVEVSR